MNTSKMASTAKNLDVLANIGSKITAVAGGICIITAFLVLIFGEKMFAGSNVTLELDFIKFHLQNNAYMNEKFIRLYAFAGALGGGVICFIVYYIAKLLRRILSPMKAGRPFEAGVSANFKKIGWVVLIGGLLSELVGMTARMLLIKAYSIEQLFASPAIAETEFIFTLNFGFMLTSCAIFLLSYIFSYGQRLQQDSDETL